MKKSVSALVALAALSLAGCGGSGGGGKDSGKSAEDELFGDLPKCSEVWKVGETLNLDDYEGCKDGEEIVAAVTKGCYDADSNYIGQVATYEDRVWVVQKGTSDQTGEGGTPGKVMDVDPKC